MFALALSYLWRHRLTSALNTLLIAIATAMLTLLLLFSTQANARFSREAEGVDLVVGAKGSPLQLILSSVFHIDQPTGNIPFDSLALLRRDPGVARAVPLALGDNFRGFRIVGTEREFLALYDAQLAQGRMNAASGEAVIGAHVARETGAGLGQRFFGSHGLGEEGAEHAHQAFTIVGRLRPTGRVIDRLIITSVETVWDVHGITHDHDDAHTHAETAAHSPHAHEDPVDHAHESGPGGAQSRAQDLQARGALEREFTAILVTYRNAAAAVRLPAAVNRQTQLQAASPAIETARLLTLFAASIAGAEIFAWLLAGVAGAAIFVAMFNAVQMRAGDMALLRVMGASRTYVFGTVLVEGVLMALLGIALGMAIGHGLLAIAILQFAVLADLGFGPLLLHPGAIAIALGIVAIAIAAAIAPALRVYGADVVKTLNQGA